MRSWDYTESYRGTVTKANNINVTPSGYYSFYTARPTLSHYANPAYAPVSSQAVFNITMPSYTGGGGVIGLETGTSTKIKGNWKLYNNTETPFGRTEGPTAGNPHGRIHGNTLRFISLNATGIALGTATAGAARNLINDVAVEFEGDLKLYGRNQYTDPITPTMTYNGGTQTGVHAKGNRPHLTVGVEIQTIAGLPNIFDNKGTINLERESAKSTISNPELGSYVIGLSAMVEGYEEYNSANTNVTGGGGGRIYPNVTFRPWASEMKNNGTINIKGIDSIGIDFAEFKFIRDADSPSYTNDFKRDAYDRKGSLNMYVKVGNINVESEDPSFGQPGNRGNESGSYGIRIPNVFHDSSKETQLTQTDTEGIYYDETIIDGKGGAVSLKGSHNVGISISKMIRGSGMRAITVPYTETTQTGTTRGNVQVGTGHISVYDYQTGTGGTEAKAKQVADRAVLDKTGRTEDDIIGNIYNLNILVDGKENVGFLRRSDFMDGDYSAAIRPLIERDMEIRDTHVENIDFSNTADGGTLFRTDRYGINLLRNLTVNPGNASVSDNRYNIVMLSNIGTQIKEISPGNVVRDSANNAVTLFQINENDTVLPKVKNTGNIIINGGKQNVIGLMAYQGAKTYSEGKSKGNIDIFGEKSIGVYAVSEKKKTGQL